MKHFISKLIKKLTTERTERYNHGSEINVDNKDKTLYYEHDFLESPRFINFFYEKVMNFDYKKHNKELFRSLFFKYNNWIKEKFTFFAIGFLLIVLTALISVKLFKAILILSILVSVVAYFMFTVVQYWETKISNIDKLSNYVTFNSQDYLILSSFLNKETLKNLRTIMDKDHRFYSLSINDLAERQVALNGKESLFSKKHLHSNHPKFLEFLELDNHIDELYNKK